MSNIDKKFIIKDYYVQARFPGFAQECFTFEMTFLLCEEAKTDCQ